MTDAKQRPMDMDVENTVSVPNLQMDFVHWSKGRARYAVWAIDVDVPAVRSASESLRHRLAGVLLPDYARQPHVTLSICGFPAVVKTHDDDYTSTCFEMQIKALCAAPVRPFSIVIGAPATFTAAPFFSVRDDQGGIACLRHALGGNGPGEPGFRYVPHVTFGLYGQSVPLGPVKRLLQSTTMPSVTVSVRQIVLMAYDAAVIDGPLCSICQFDLERQELRVIDAHAMEVLLPTARA